MRRAVTMGGLYTTTMPQYKTNAYGKRGHARPCQTVRMESTRHVLVNAPLWDILPTKLNEMADFI